jgi:hypothetical protein
MILDYLLKRFILITAFDDESCLHILCSCLVFLEILTDLSWGISPIPKKEMTLSVVSDLIILHFSFLKIEGARGRIPNASQPSKSSKKDKREYVLLFLTILQGQLYLYPSTC